jgi:ElaB/YqjD/DUF883 family membrane-anchored ribosome-binding protein
MQGSVHGAASALDQASDTLDRLTDTAQQTLGRVSAAASNAASRLSDKSQELLDSRAMQNARVYVREHPLMAIAIAVAVGLIISRLTSRR